jgi:hypothetical protein
MSLSTNCSKGDTYVITPKGKNFHIDLKCTWKKSGSKLLAPITSRKNERKSNKNLEAMIKVTKAQLPK